MIFVGCIDSCYVTPQLLVLKKLYLDVARASLSSHALVATCASRRIATQFAEASLVMAHRLLLRAALEDERNSMFLLVSEACIPLYHPGLVWAQLISESHVSRVSGRRAPYGWFSSMRTEHFHAQHMSKGGQWMSLTRMHAMLAAADEHVWTRFQAYCSYRVRASEVGDLQFSVMFGARSNVLVECGCISDLPRGRL
jgi:hypothetical protein